MTAPRWLQWRGSTSQNIGGDAKLELTEPTNLDSVSLVSSPEAAPAGFSGEPSRLDSERSELGVASTKKAPVTINQEDPPSLSYADWKATALNRLFHEQGRTGQPGRITGATVLEGERHKRTASSQKS